MKQSNPEREGFTAEELGEASIYDDATQIAQQMRRGDETQGDPNSRDIAGVAAFKDTEEGRTDRDTVPRTKEDVNNRKDTKNADTTMRETMSPNEGTNDEKRTEDAADAASGRS